MEFKPPDSDEGMGPACDDECGKRMSADGYASPRAGGNEMGEGRLSYHDGEA